MCRVNAEEVWTDHVSDHALRFSSDVSMERMYRLSFCRNWDFAAWIERVVENKLIRDPYPNRTLFSKEEQRSEKGGVAQWAFAERMTQFRPIFRLSATCELGFTTIGRPVGNRRRPRVNYSSQQQAATTSILTVNMARACSIAILVGDIRAFTSSVSRIKPSVTAALYTIFEKNLNLLTNSLNVHGKL